MTPEITPLYTLARYINGHEVFSLHRQTHRVTKGIVALVWGTVPVALEEGGAVQEEWKFNLGGPNWLIVERTA